MSHPAGRERLEQLARQKRQEREQRAAQREEERARAAEGRVIERAKTAELYRWCLATFSGYRLPETGQELCVSWAAWADAVNVHAYLGDTRLAPGAEYVGLALSHPGLGAGEEQRFLLLVLARFAGGHYEVIDDERALSVRSQEEAQDCLLNFVADLGGDRLGGLVDRVGRQGARFRPGGPT